MVVYDANHRASLFNCGTWCRQVLGRSFSVAWEASDSIVGFEAPVGYDRHHG